MKIIDCSTSFQEMNSLVGKKIIIVAVEFNIDRQCWELAYENVVDIREVKEDGRTVVLQKDAT